MATSTLPRRRHDTMVRAKLRAGLIGPKHKIDCASCGKKTFPPFDSLTLSGRTYHVQCAPTDASALASPRDSKGEAGLSRALEALTTSAVPPNTRSRPHLARAASSKPEGTKRSTDKQARSTSQERSWKKRTLGRIFKRKSSNSSLAADDVAKPKGRNRSYTDAGGFLSPRASSSNPPASPSLGRTDRRQSFGSLLLNSSKSLLGRQSSSGAQKEQASDSGRQPRGLDRKRRNSFSLRTFSRKRTPLLRPRPSLSLSEVPAAVNAYHAADLYPHVESMEFDGLLGALKRDFIFRGKSAASGTHFLASGDRRPVGGGSASAFCGSDVVRFLVEERWAEDEFEAVVICAHLTQRRRILPYHGNHDFQNSPRALYVFPEDIVEANEARHRPLFDKFVARQRQEMLEQMNALPRIWNPKPVAVIAPPLPPLEALPAVPATSEATEKPRRSSLRRSGPSASLLAPTETSARARRSSVSHRRAGATSTKPGTPSQPVASLPKRKGPIDRRNSGYRAGRAGSPDSAARSRRAKTPSKARVRGSSDWNALFTPGSATFVPLLTAPRSAPGVPVRLDLPAGPPRLRRALSSQNAAERELERLERLSDARDHLLCPLIKGQLSHARHEFSEECAWRLAVAQEEEHHELQAQENQAALHEQFLGTKRKLKQALLQNSIFEEFKDEQLEAVIGHLDRRPVRSGADVIRQGDVGEAFFVIEAGEFDVLVSRDGEEEQVVAGMSAFDSFGELALLYDTPRTATIRATEDSIVWSLERRVFRSVTSGVSAEKLSNVHAHLAVVPTFLVKRKQIRDAPPPLQSIQRAVLSKHFTERWDAMAFAQDETMLPPPFETTPAAV